MKEKKDWEELAKTFGSSAAGKRPRWAKESEWGNDGLVTVQSAKWGTFWGIMENCDRKSLPPELHGSFLIDAIRLGDERGEGDRIRC